MSVQMCYRIKDNIKISKIQLSSTFPRTVTVFVRSIGCFELLSYITILYINVFVTYYVIKICYVIHRLKTC